MEYRWTVLKSVYQWTLAICGRVEMASYCTIPPFDLNIVVLGPLTIVQPPQISYLPNGIKVPDGNLLVQPSNVNAGVGTMAVSEQMCKCRRFEIYW